MEILLKWLINKTEMGQIQQPLRKKYTAMGLQYVYIE